MVDDVLSYIFTFHGFSLFFIMDIPLALEMIASKSYFYSMCYLLNIYTKVSMRQGWSWSAIAFVCVLEWPYLYFKLVSCR